MFMTMLSERLVSQTKGEVMSNKRYPEEFRIEAVKQVTELGHAVSQDQARPA